MQILQTLGRLLSKGLPASLAGAMFACLGALVAPAPAHAVIGTLDNVPAATLLLPYFEVDLNNGNGPQTSIRVSNASASAGMLNVTLWTDWGLPTKSFGVYMTGYDTVDIDLRSLFKGLLPRTADDGADPTDTISPQGLYSQDINFPGNGPAGIPFTTLMSPTAVLDLRNAHTGVASGTFSGQCGGQAYGDGIARGYVTIDDMISGTGLDQANPTSAGYFGAGFTGIVGNRNIWVGSYTVTNRTQHSVTTDALVHIEASSTDPLTSTAGNPTFYSRFNTAPNNFIDYREPLNSVWDLRYMNGGVFTGGTRAEVWRDPVTTPTPASCGSQPAGLPGNLRQIVAWDEQENVAFNPQDPPDPVAGSVASFPLVAQSVNTAPLSPFTFGMLRLNFNDGGSTAPFSGSRQAFVRSVHTATGRYGVSVPAVGIAPHRSTPGMYTGMLTN